MAFAPTLPFRAPQAEGYARIVTSNSELLLEFLIERDDLLDAIESLALSLELEPDNHLDLRFLFQAVHSLKSNLGILGFHQFELSCQHVEDLLAETRKIESPVEGETISATLALVDAVRAHFDAWS